MVLELLLVVFLVDWLLPVPSLLSPCWFKKVLSSVFCEDDEGDDDDVLVEFDVDWLVVAVFNW